MYFMPCSRYCASKWTLKLGTPDGEIQAVTSRCVDVPDKMEQRKLLEVRGDGKLISWGRLPYFQMISKEQFETDGEVSWLNFQVGGPIFHAPRK